MTDFVKAEPTKEFFVEMLTRDIELEDAIFDLLDNCLDGVARRFKNQDGTSNYDGRYVNIDISDQVFSISDNCGGIPRDIAENYAFMLGRPNSVKVRDEFTLGTYGIGMKRAIFKIGRRASVVSHSGDDSFKVTIAPDWVNLKDWLFPIEEIKESETKGTSIEIDLLNETTKERFEDPQFISNLANRVRHIYSYTIQSGFSIIINGNKIEAYRNSVIWEGVDTVDGKNSITPYIFKDNVSEVDIIVIVGLYRPLPTVEELEDGMQAEVKYSSEDAGWTVVANDRIIVYKDKSRLTGWGTESIPQYHTQFISISGMVFFKSRDARNLPVTTTKRGLDIQSEVWQTALKYMREGLRIFIDFTNNWKEDSKKQKSISVSGKAVDPAEIVDQISNISLRKVNNSQTATRLIPRLPQPSKNQSDQIVVRFTTKAKMIENAASFLSIEADKPSIVAQKGLEYVAELGEE